MVLCGFMAGRWLLSVGRSGTGSRHGHGENVHVREAAGRGSSHGLSSKCSAAACKAKNQTTSLNWPGVPLCQLAKGSGGNFTKLCF